MYLFLSAGIVFYRVYKAVKALVDVLAVSIGRHYISRLVTADSTPCLATVVYGRLQ